MKQRRKKRAGTALLAGMVAATYLVSDGAAAADLPGMTYESLEDLPDFAGSWIPIPAPLVTPASSASPQAPLPSAPAAVGQQAALEAAAQLALFSCSRRGAAEIRPEVIARCREFIPQAFAKPPVDYFCAKPKFAGLPPEGLDGGSFEVLFTPGRVTIALESGLVRRVYLRDEPPAGALHASAGGTSIGRWEGSTLVIETTGLDPQAPFIPGSTLGANASVLERISLQDADILEIESTLTAPAVLLAPLAIRAQYRRARDRLFTDSDKCVEGDRSFDIAGGKERFDLTPPEDLPPPPSD
jgi:hypothetical protein